MVLQAMQNFKLRTLALLEAYSQAVPGSGLIAGILPDLVRAAEAAGKPGAPKVMTERLRAVVAKLCRCQLPPPLTVFALLLVGLDAHYMKKLQAMIILPPPPSPPMTF